jgi:DNA-binding transcriptional LysR family regulator
MLAGSLRIGADAPYHVFPLIASFSGRYPGVRLAFDFGNTAHVLAGLLARDTDVAILPEVPADARIEARFLRRDRLIVFTHRGHDWARRRSIRFAELATQRVLLREPGSTTRAILERGLEEAGLALADSLEVGSREAVREGVAANLGVGIVAESEFGADDRLHRLAVRDVDLGGAEFVACLKEKRDDRVVRAFLELLPSAEGS